MWVHALVVAAAVITACGQLAFYKGQIADDVTITCAYRNDTRDNVSYVTSLVISKSVDGHDQVIASINSIRKDSVGYVTDAQVTGSMDSAHDVDSNVIIKWTNTSEGLNGDYSCTLNGLDQHDEERAITQKLTLQLKDTDPEIQATPSHIVDGFTPALIVDCFLTNLAVYDTSELLGVKISHSENGTSRLIARLTGTSVPIVAGNNIDSLADGWEVVSSYFGTKSAYLSVKLPRPATKDSGQYTCDISTSNSSLSIVKSVDVTASDSTKQYVYDRLTDQESLQDYYLFACNFEHGICGLNLSGPSNLPSWTVLPDRLRGQGLYYDDPPENVFGHYLTVEKYDTSSNALYTIETKLIPPIRRSTCISFWLLVPRITPSVYTYTRQNGVLYNVKTTTGSYRGSWRQKLTTLPPIAQPFTVVIQIQGGNTDFITVDDLIISDLNCE